MEETFFCCTLHSLRAYDLFSCFVSVAQLPCLSIIRHSLVTTRGCAEKHHMTCLKHFSCQNSLLKDQIGHELRKRQQYISQSARAGEDIRDLRSVLDHSLTTVIRDPNLDPILLDQESKRLDESLGYSRTGGLSTPRRSARSPGRTLSPGRGGVLGYGSSSPQYRAQRSPILRRKIKN